VIEVIEFYDFLRKRDEKLRMIEIEKKEEKSIMMAD